MLDVPSATRDSASHSRVRVFSPSVIESDGDNLLLLLAIDRVGLSTQQGGSVINKYGGDDHHADDLGSKGVVDNPIALALSEWR